MNFFLQIPKFVLQSLQSIDQSIRSSLFARSLDLTNLTINWHPFSFCRLQLFDTDYPMAFFLIRNHSFHGNIEYSSSLMSKHIGQSLSSVKLDPSLQQICIWYSAPVVFVCALYHRLLKVVSVDLVPLPTDRPPPLPLQSRLSSTPPPTPSKAQRTPEHSGHFKHVFLIKTDSF